MLFSLTWKVMTIPAKRVDDQTALSHEAIREADEIFNSHLRRVGLKHSGAARYHSARLSGDSRSSFH